MIAQAPRDCAPRTTARSRSKSDCATPFATFFSCIGVRGTVIDIADVIRVVGNMARGDETDEISVA